MIIQEILDSVDFDFLLTQSSNHRERTFAAAAGK